MRRHRALRGLRFALMIVIGVAVFGFAVEHLWNWLVPAIFGWKTISFVQALGLLILSKILFGGFHGKGHGGRWGRHHMDERWANMSPEDRERFRSGMRRDWRGCRKESPTEPATERTGA